MNSDLNPEEFAVFRKFLVDACGILLGDSKQYLVKNRLTGLLRESDFSSIAQLIAALRSDNVPVKLKTRVIDAMTTNETFWFRDNSHFEELRNVLLPAWAANPTGGTLRIWSAACSSGQEPYSIGICVEEFFRYGWTGIRRNVQIIGTDISESILAEATQAAYSEMALSRGLDESLRSRYFERYQDKWKLKPEITDRVRFQQFNLLKPFAALGRFDIVFCRNVLIYFSEDLKRDILTRVAKVLNPGGYLFLSSTESLPSGLDLYETVRGPTCRYYRLRATF
ncbi:chemotaxis protein methyltransferase [Methylocaldum marinum]|uniref:protein-glutamate O-methyltransferase n=1 Tax=Methylocaldum marinum TaxID=1432792 RepID=A0A250KM24_9GAMM|nr:protein-glutamate O-methyltransferase CheR [Methylocaldum marinum]BBA32606.1 chemotaxis protein methyltransferase [Methylocaldum marinum]